MANQLPTVPGTILSFSSDFESPGEMPMRYAATLLIGSFDGLGNAIDTLWGTADLEGLDDELNSFTEDFLAAQDFTVLSEPELLPASVAIDGDEVLELNYGSVVRVSAYGEVFYSVFAPLYLDHFSGEIAEAAWISSYGEVPDFDEADSIELLYRGTASTALGFTADGLSYTRS